MTKEYIAFISYSRRDKDVAEWLHQKLEKYVLPENARTTFTFSSKYFRPVFLDTKDLHVEQRPFTDEIKNALDNSSYLIVLCSKKSAVSPFVRMEIEYFLQSHNNNLSLIVPLFIDEVNGSVPPSFDGTSIMERHFPIFNTKLSFKSEANNYCFFQIVSYILGIDFSMIYNRYEVQSAKEQRNKRKRLIRIIAVLGTFLVILGVYHYLFKLKSDFIIEMKERQIQFEKSVFPAAVVDGYEKNFMTPVIKYLKKTPNRFSIFVLMPKNEKDLTHADRVEDFEYNAQIQNVIDSLYVEKLDTDTKRGSSILRVVKNGRTLENIYLDFATTTTSFLKVSEFKKHFREYRRIPKDYLINEYSEEFVKQLKTRLGRDSIYVKFFNSPQDLIMELSKSR